jgi:hypothetical protein
VPEELIKKMSKRVKLGPIIFDRIGLMGLDIGKIKVKKDTKDV